MHARSADGFTALHFAAFLGGASAVKALLDAGADATAIADNTMRVRPLHSAAALVDLLLAAGADVTPCNEEGRDAVSFAADNGPAEIAARIRESRTSPLSD